MLQLKRLLQFLLALLVLVAELLSDVKAHLLDLVRLLLGALGPDRAELRL